MANIIWQEPPSIPLLQWLVRGSLKQNLLQAIRLWVWLHLLYGEAEELLALPETFGYVDWRDRFFTPDHPTHEAKPGLHDPACPCSKLTAAWLFHPDLSITQAQWVAYHKSPNGQARSQQQCDRLQQTLLEHDLLPPSLDLLLFKTRLFGFTRRTLASDLHHLVNIGWLLPNGKRLQKVTSWPDYPHPGAAATRSSSGPEIAYFTQPDLAAIADNFARTFQGHPRFFVHVDYVISQQKLDRVDDWQAQLSDLWQQHPIPPLRLDYQGAGENQAHPLVVYPVCIYYYRRGPYLCAYGQTPNSPPSAVDWRNYRLDRLLNITPLSWEHPTVPAQLQHQHNTQTLPTPEVIETAMEEAWGFDYYQPSKLLLLRFDQTWDRRYIRDTLRHATFRRIPYRQADALLRRALTGQPQAPLLSLWEQRSPEDAYYQAYYRQNDPNVLQRLRAWRPHVEVLLPLDLRQRMAQEVRQERAFYSDD